MNCETWCFGVNQQNPPTVQIEPLFSRDSMMLYTGESNVSVKLRSSTLSQRTGLSVTGSRHLTGTLGWYLGSLSAVHAHSTSSIVNGTPSDHRRPSRIWNVRVLPSSLHPQSLPTKGRHVKPSASRSPKLDSACSDKKVNVVLRRLMPPYTPIWSGGCEYIRSSGTGTRSSSGWITPCLTRSADIGDSKNLVGMGPA